MPFDKMFHAGDIYADVLVASVTFAAVFVFLRWLKQIRVRDDGKRYPPSLPVLQLYSSILRGGMSVLPEHFMRSAEKLGSIFSFKVAGRLVVVLNGYDTIFKALKKQSETFADRGPAWMEEAVINHERRGFSFGRYNDVFRKNHKLVLSILREFGFGIERVTETRILQEVESMNEEIRSQNGRPMCPKWMFTFATSKVVMSILFGRNFLHSFPKVHSAIVENATECVSNMDLTLNMVPVVRFLPNFRRKVNRLRESSDRMLNAIEAGIKFNNSSKFEPTFIERFIEIQDADYDPRDLLFILRDLCFGGTGTVSALMEWAMVELANHQEILGRLQREIDEMVPEDRLPSLDDKPRLPYTEAVILELMRRRTTLPFFLPHAPLKDTKLLGYDIPQGCLILPNGYSAHMDPKTWTDPENFRPERFLDKDNNIINSEKVIAFGLGKRSCIGEILGRQTAFLFLTSLVKRFDIRPPEGQKSIKVKEDVAISTVPTHFEVRLIPRVKPTEQKYKC